MTNTACMCIGLRRAGRAVTRFYDDALAPAGVNATQFSQLRAILRAGSPTIGALADATDLDRSTLGRNIRVLGRMGLVRFEPGADERTRLVSVTADGKRVLKAATPLWRTAQSALAEKLGAGRRAVLFDLLHELETVDV